MDETEVTNHQYVEFLNQVLPKLKVEKELVYGDGQLWAILGQIMEGYEPIIFDHDKFAVNGAQHASCPALRVTAYGAAAYAKFYRRRLPTEEEWLYVALEGIKTRVEPGNASKTTGVEKDENTDETHMDNHMSASSSSRTTMPRPSPVMLAKSDEFGILGLNGDFGEWAVRKRDYVVLGRYGSEQGKASDLPSAVHRYPWEAFQDVGFRCVRSVQGGG
jgi:serine/threonine-protein kinase